MQPLSPILTILLTILALTSCDSNNTKSRGIQGEWLWKKSEGFYGTLSPNSLGVHRKLIIDDFTYREYENYTLIFESAYDITVRDTITYIDFESGSSLMLNVDDFELQLTEYLWTHGYCHYFIRQ